MRADEALLCACAGRRVAADVDWDALLHTAAAHGVTDVLLPSLATGGTHAPPPILAQLEKRALEATGQNLNRATQLARLLQHFSDRGIRALAFKGPTLAAGIYGHLARRVSSDLDVLIERRHTPQIRPLLLAHGYTLAPRAPYRGGSLLYGLLPSAGKDDIFVPDHPLDAPVEVHVAFAFWPLDIRLDMDAMFDRAVHVDIAGRAIPTLCPDDLMLALTIHGTMHAWRMLRFVSDIDAAATHVGDWPAVMARAEAAGMARMLWVALLLAKQLLDTAIPDHVATRASSDPRAVAIARDSAARMFDAGAANVDLNRPWLAAFLDGPRRRLRFWTRNLIYEWLLKWPWDAWLGRRYHSRDASR